MVAPQGYRQVIDSRAYVQARMAAARRGGILRFALPMLFPAAALVCAAVVTVIGHINDPLFVITAACMVAIGAALVLFWFSVLPQAMKKRALSDYATYDRLCNPCEVTFLSDELLVKSAVLTRRTEYAKVRLCVETPKRFAVLTDDGVTVILEKACFANEEATTLFLRAVFARRYVKERAR